MTTDGAIVVYGATGLTGGLVVEALLARGVKPVVAGRDEARVRAVAARFGLGDASVRVAQVDEPASLARLVAPPVRVLVACAGPFLTVGEPVVAACAARGVGYVDSTGEGPFVQMVARRYDATARARGCTVAPSCAFEVAVGDAAASRAAAGLGDGLEVEVAYALSEFATSRGTRASAALTLARKGLALVDGQVREEPVAAQRRTVTFRGPPAGARVCLSMPSPEVVTVARHVPARAVRTFVAVPRAPGLVRALARAVEPLSAAGGGAMMRLLFERAGRAGPDAAAREAARFEVVATARTSDGQRTRRVSVVGRDVYGLSGVLLAEAAMAIARGDVSAKGVVAPTQVLGAERVFRLVGEVGGEGSGVQVDES